MKLSLSSFAIIGAFAFSISTGAQAQIMGGSNLLTSAGLGTLSADLGEGPLQITNIFSHSQGDGKTATDFHAAVDGKGRTFSIVKVTAYNNTASFNAIIGGYNPQSWSSSDGYHIDGTDVGRTAFLFNLTSGVEQKQCLVSQGGYNAGYYQTYNAGYYGPTFGGGHDIYVDSTLSSGYVYNYSYGGSSFTTNILGNPGGSFYTSGLVYSNLEVFAIAPGMAPIKSETTSVPEPGTCVLVASLGLTGVVLLRRKQVRKGA